MTRLRSVGPLLVFASVALSAQPALRQQISLGLWGAVGGNLHAPDLQLALGRYDRSSVGFGWGIGGAVAVPVNTSLGVGFRVGYEALGATLRSAADSTLRTAVGAVELFPHVSIWLGKGGLYLPLGVEVGIGTGASFQPQGQTTWQDIPEQALRIALGGGMGWAIPLGRSTTLAPEIGIRVPLTDVSGDAQWKPWKVTQTRVAVALYFGSSKKPGEPVPEEKSPTVALSTDVARLQVEEVRLTEYFPLLPYVFFEEGKATPIAEYTLQAGKAQFSLERMPADALHINRMLLDVVGKRLDEYPLARLTVTGTTDGRRESIELARQRAEWVKQYLVTSWGISPERITVQAQRYPSKPSASHSTVPEDRRDGDAENRRVELNVTIPDVLDPIPLTAENQRFVRPEILAWDLQLESADPIVSWELTLSQAGEIIDVLRGQGQPESPLRWRAAAAKLRASELPLEYALRVTDAKGRTAQAIGSLPVEYISSFRKRSERLPDRTVTRFSLILFDFDSDVLTPENQRVLEQLVVPAVQANSTVRIVGYTDRIGERDYNQGLSLRRARRVRDFLAARIPAARYEIAGYGESILLFENASPIGRQLCRTVQITIETPHASP